MSKRPIRVFTPWAKKAVELLSDGEPRPYSEILLRVMDAVPPNRALKTYRLARKNNVPSDVPLEHQIKEGAKRVAKGALRSEQFIIENSKTGMRVWPDRYNIDDLTIRLNLSTSDEDMRPSTHLIDQTASVSDEAVLEGTNTSNRMKTVAFERALYKEFPFGSKLKGVPVWTRGEAGGPFDMRAGFITREPGSVKIYEVWPEVLPPREYSDVYSLFKEESVNWLFLKSKKKG